MFLAKEIQIVKLVQVLFNILLYTFHQYKFSVLEHKLFILALRCHYM